jgi:hypothetical protein
LSFLNLAIKVEVARTGKGRKAALIHDDILLIYGRYADDIAVMNP